ncbi:MAG: hypothetical protein NC222_06580 [Staphylococcus sp.]|nr:hypothetical protein [Staphylococcus sp.]
MSKIIDIENNFNDFRNGALKAIELFKADFDVNKNVLIYKEKKIHINNTELLLEQNNSSNKEFNFGFNFIVNSIDEFRKKLCINPILYLVIIEYVFNNLPHIRLVSNFLNKIEKFVLDYYNNSSFKNVRPKFEELCYLQKDNIKNDFLKEVAKVSYDLSYITIKEEKFNLVEKNPYYILKANHYGSKNIYKNYETIIWFSNITKKELLEFEEFVLLNHKKMIVFYNNINEDAFEKVKQGSNFNDSIVYVHVPGLSFYDKMRDIQLITNSQINYFDSNFQSIYDYKFGLVKYLEFNGSNVKIIGTKSFKGNEKELFYLKNSKNLDRYLTIINKSYIINSNEDILENVRYIVSASRSMYNDGVFYNEINCLRLINYFFKENNQIQNFALKLLKDFLYLIEGEQAYKDVLTIKNNNDFTVTFDIKTKKFTKENMFVPFEMYKCTFDLIKSNLSIINNFYKGW